MSERHHVTRPLVEPEVERRGEHGLCQPRRQALVEPPGALLPQDLGHAVQHSGVPVRPPERPATVAESLNRERVQILALKVSCSVVTDLHLQPLLGGVEGEDGGLGAQPGEAAAEDALGHGHPLDGGEDGLEDLVEEGVEAELESGVRPDGGEGGHEAPEERPRALGPQHLGGGVDGARVRPLVALSSFSVVPSIE